ncbi:kinase-like domain-containing protein [Chaetomium strumarium]|uniref:Kinase-like domain-containing protein n=1 Tax=Chaetomium strumarium TaxID=1170767 RepID=A0AAJ0GWS7_9PEZI|nr:kinase-like domain-containing protein [Chaetomium strumarium]
MSHNEPWPPVPPDIDTTKLEVEMPELVVSANSTLFRVKGQPSTVYKFRGLPHEYQLQKARGGDCAIPVRGRVLGKSTVGAGDVTLSLPQRRDIMDQMIRTVQQLHAKRIVHEDIKLENMLLDSCGKLRLCDFAEGRYLDEDECLGGQVHWHFESPNRLRRGERLGYGLPPPIIEDDLYGLGLSIWQLYTGRTPHEDMVCDDLGLKERQRNGETVNVAEVGDPEARDIIVELLRRGGARI